MSAHGRLIEEARAEAAGLREAAEKMDGTMQTLALVVASLVTRLADALEDASAAK